MCFYGSLLDLGRAFATRHCRLFVSDYRRREHSDAEAAALGPSLVLVISPLVALMTDQVLDLRRRDVRADVLSSGRSGLDERLLATDEDLASSSLIFSAPEAFVCSKWRDVLESSGMSSRVVAIAFDEAHCVSKW